MNIFLFACIALVVIFPSLGIANTPSQPPFYDAIMKIMAPLEYSGVPVMANPRVTLTIDFNQRTWTLHHIHEYDDQGVIVLEQGRYGLCAELATYLYEKIKPLLDERYGVRFAMVAESGFFSTAQSNHIVLVLVDRTDNQVYLIDPSFHKYARIQDLKDYQVINIQDSLSFVKDKSHDSSFGVNQAIPLYIKNDYLLSFSVTAVDGKFDKDNFILAVSATRRFKFTGRDIIFIGRRNKEFEDVQEKEILNQILTPQDINTLFDKLKSWIEKAEFR